MIQACQITLFDKELKIRLGSEAHFKSGEFKLIPAIYVDKLDMVNAISNQELAKFFTSG